MGAGEEISKAAKNAMEDLAGTAEPTDDAHVPEPGQPGEPIKVHSSISEATNATDAEREGEGSSEEALGRSATAPASGSSASDTSSDTTDGGMGGKQPDRMSPTNVGGGTGDGDGTLGNEAVGQAATGGEVRGPAGLPDPDPEDGSAEPLEADQDPSTGMGRG